jgi:hypothetical protein
MNPDPPLLADPAPGERPDAENRHLGVRSAIGRLRVAQEGDSAELHSLALVNQATCRELIDRGHDVNTISGAERAVEVVREVAGRNRCLSLRERPHVLGAKGNGGEGYFRGASAFTNRSCEP